MSDTKKTVLVAGGAGFVGSNLIRMLLRERESWRVVCLDSLELTGGLSNLQDCQGHKQLRFFKGDICDVDVVAEVFGTGVDVVVNLAEKRENPGCLGDSADLVRNNVQGTQVLLDAAREAEPELFLQVSTDEVYGALGSEGYITEDTRLMPGNPYGASKAGADMLVQAYFKRYELPTIVARCSNNYGPYQSPDRLIAMFVTNLIQGKKVSVHGSGMQVRDWIHVDDHCRALMTVIEQGEAGEVYNIGSGKEMKNIDLTRMIIGMLGESPRLIKFVKDRPGHDKRYALDTGKLKKLGWKPAHKFENALKETIDNMSAIYDQADHALKALSSTEKVQLHAEIAEAGDIHQRIMEAQHNLTTLYSKIRSPENESL